MKRHKKLNESDLEKVSKLYFLYPFFKRLFDLLFSTFIILILSPLYFLLALLIKWDSKGPVLFRSKRLGKGEKHINIFKFRTMYVNAEERLKEMVGQNPKIKEEWEKYKKLYDDPRCTPIGKFLRKTSLDEFPQFFNVLIGDLSVVGPRPHLIEELDKNTKSPFKKKAHIILKVKPGITGLWQISGRNILSFEDRVELDSLYCKKRSFFYDAKVFFKTIPLVLMKKGAI